jgi:transcriptional regulator with XRE-family HTH domain
MKVNNPAPAVSSPVSPFSAALDTTIKRYRISAKELSKLTKVSENHISEFRRGKGDISTTVLAKLLDGMDTLAPGSQQHYCHLIAGIEKQSISSLKQSLMDIIEVADEDELLDAMGAIANRFRCLRSYSVISPSQSLVNVNDCA